MDLPWINQREHLQLLSQWVQEPQPFLYMRFNDGEVNGMFRLVSPNSTTSGEHHQFRDLGKALLESFTILCTGPHVNSRIMLGTYLFTEPNNPSAKVLADYMRQQGLPKTNITWGGGDFWYTTKGEEQGIVYLDEPISTIDAVRNSGRQVILVGNAAIARASLCLNAHFLEIPRTDAWNNREAIMTECRPWAMQGGLFIWCSGLPAKVWAQRLWAEYPQSSHLDMGSLFDGVYGVGNRGWSMRKSGPHWEAFATRFIPYVTQFIGVNDPKFWRGRLASAKLAKQLYRAVYDVDPDIWQNIQEVHRAVLARELQPNQKVLDAGCGYGALCEILPAQANPYLGVDLSPDFIHEARSLYPTRDFLVGDLRQLPFADKHFDLAVCRSVQDMVEDNLGKDAWAPMEAELRRVSHRILMLGYRYPCEYRVLE